MQAALIAKRIRVLADEKGVPVFAFAEDVAASGGYWLALAADEIYADENSIIGSIGVISAGFGFPGLLERLGIERRLHAVGPRKGMLDPFLEEKAADVKRLKGLQADIHASFMYQVRERRAGKLKAAEKELFSGRVLDRAEGPGTGAYRWPGRSARGHAGAFRGAGQAAPGWASGNGSCAGPSPPRACPGGNPETGRPACWRRWRNACCGAASGYRANSLLPPLTAARAPLYKDAHVRGSALPSCCSPRRSSPPSGTATNGSGGFRPSALPRASWAAPGPRPGPGGGRGHDPMPGLRFLRCHGRRRLVRPRGLPLSGVMERGPLPP